MSDLQFVIHRPKYDPDERAAEFTYTLGEYAFAETLQFDGDWPLTRDAATGLDPLLNVAAAVLGTSYFKLLAPFQIVSEVPLSRAAIRLVEDVYTNGLGEFYARNDLQRFGQLTFEIAESPPSPTTPPDPNDPALLLIGGGKDSLASAQILEALDEPFTPFAVNPKGPILTSIDALGRKPLHVRRQIDPRLLELNQSPGTYNGHVPSTAMNMCIAAISARLFGFSKIVLSNEHSASEGNRPFDGRMVNHQHSKSLGFERLFAGMLDETLAGLAAFSLLRPFSEARIAEIFARETRFDHAFSSCNRNFRIAGHDGDLWCCDCPKCRFVFLILAPHMQKDRLTSIFGKNLLDDAGQIDGFRELCGLTGQKPWECVGEIMEAASALHRLNLDQDWRHDCVIQTLGPELTSHYGQKSLDDGWHSAMHAAHEHSLPGPWAKRVIEYAD